MVVADFLTPLTVGAGDAAREQQYAAVLERVVLLLDGKYWQYILLVVILEDCSSAVSSQDTHCHQSNA